MIQDPIQPLADIGRRVLQTVRYFATLPASGQPLESYETQLRDPVVALSGLCDELLRLAAAGAAAEPENIPDAAMSRFATTTNPGSAFPAFSRAGTATRIAADGPDETADSPTEYQATERSTTPKQGFNGTFPFEQYPQSIEDPAPDEPGSRGLWEEAVREPGEAAPRTDSPEAPLRPVTERRVPSVRDMRNPAGLNGEPSSEEGGETRPPTRKEWPEFRQTEVSSDARASENLRRAENGQALGAGESGVPMHGSRLTGSTERLAALLRSHVAQPEPATRTAEKDSQEREDVLPSRQGDDERGTYRIEDQPVRASGRVGIEEIMERLADELETEFVRTYGSSGG